MKKQKKLCSVMGCGHVAYAGGLCRAHRRRRKLYGEVYADIPLGRSGAGMTPPKRRSQAAVPAGFKQCTTCKHVKLLAAFPKDRSGKQGRCHHCTECQRDYWLQFTYGVTNQDYESLLARQKNRCALCQTTNLQKQRGTRLAVDHDHKTGQIRGLLCRACNQLVIGIIEKRNISIDRLRKYLSGACALKR